MKQFTKIIFTIAALTSSEAFAENNSSKTQKNYTQGDYTQGNYVGIDVSRVSMSNKYQISGENISNYSSFRDSGTGFGISYKHAFNRDKVFIAPGIFFDKLDLEARDHDNDIVSSDYRYGIKLEIGYDVNDKFAAYMTNGFSNVDYKVDWQSIGKVKSGSKLSHFIGLGSIYKISNDVSLNIEYNLQSIVLDTPDESSINQVKLNLSALKFGVSYHF